MFAGVGLLSHPQRVSKFAGLLSAGKRDGATAKIVERKTRPPVKLN